MTKRSVQGSANEWLLTPKMDKSWIVNNSTITAAAADDDNDDDDDSVLGAIMNGVTSQ